MIGGATTNDFTPVSNGTYSFWAFEVLAYPKSTQWASVLGQNLDYASQFTPLVNRFLATYTGTPINGSIDYEIQLSKTAAPAYATAVRLSEGNVSRSAVGGTIAP
jgi:hypothetical protein